MSSAVTVVAAELGAVGSTASSATGSPVPVNAGITRGSVLPYAVAVSSKGLSTGQVALSGFTSKLIEFVPLGARSKMLTQTSVWAPVLESVEIVGSPADDGVVDPATYATPGAS